jgi:hypothetical protein
VTLGVGGVLWANHIGAGLGPAATVSNERRGLCRVGLPCPTGQKALFVAGTIYGMTDSDRLSRFLRAQVQSAGRQYQEARQAFLEARNETAAEIDDGDLPTARIVCRRHAEQRVVGIDGEGKPSCFEAGHPDCEGCAEDVRAGRIETW